jgi:hypothetical protein
VEAHLHAIHERASEGNAAGGAAWSMNAQGHELAPQGTLGSLGTGNEKLAIASVHSGDPVRVARSPCNPLPGEARAIWDLCAAAFVPILAESGIWG